MYQVTIISSEAPSYEELEESVVWLNGCLDEARQSKSNTERWGMVALVLFAVSTTLLALTWGGVIVV